MNLRFHKRFDKRYEKLNSKLQVKVESHWLAEMFKTLYNIYGLTKLICQKYQRINQKWS